MPLLVFASTRASGALASTATSTHQFIPTLFGTKLAMKAVEEDEGLDVLVGVELVVLDDVLLGVELVLDDVLVAEVVCEDEVVFVAEVVLLDDVAVAEVVLTLALVLPDDVLVADVVGTGELVVEVVAAPVDELCVEPVVVVVVEPVALVADCGAMSTSQACPAVLAVEPSLAVRRNWTTVPFGTLKLLAQP